MNTLRGWMVIAVLACSLYAQQPEESTARIIAPPERRPLPPPTLKVEAERPIELRSLQVEVQIRGLQAETSQTLVFHNPNNRQLAGDLEFPLPDAATVSGYALDVQGRMVDGVVVTKQKARVILETEQRRRVDPGLVEHVRGNQFNTRVFPIPAHGQRTIRVTYVSDLRFVGDDALYELPLPRGTRIPTLEIELNIAKGPVEPELGKFGNLSLTDWNDRWQANTRIQDAEVLEDLQIRLPKLPRSWSALEHFQQETFVALMDRPALTEQTDLAQPPSRFALAWDASGSRSSDAVNAELALLRVMLKSWPDTTVDLMVIRNRPEAVIAFSDHNKLLRYLEELPRDGGTDLAAVDFRKAALPHKEDAFWLLVSDALYTLGEGLPAFDSVPVYGLSAEGTRDRALLRFLAEATQGLVFDGRRSRPADLLQGILDRNRVQVEVEDPEGILQDLQQEQDSSSAVVRVYAKAAKSGSVSLVYRRNGQELDRRDFRLSLDEAQEGAVLARAWAAHQALALSVFPEENASKLRHLGNRYRLVTPGTSLLVLESLDQYVNYEVEPPASWPEMREQYHAALKSRNRAQAQRTSNKIDTVVGWWEQRVAWWEKDFSHKNIQRRLNKWEKGGGFAGGLRLFGGQAARTQAESAPPPPMQSRTGNFDPMDDGMEMVLEEAAPAALSVGGAADYSFDGLSDGEVLGRQRLSKEVTNESGTAQARVALKAWSPDTPYLKAIRIGDPKGAYLRYLEQREEYAKSPAFFLDAAGELLQSNPDMGLRVLSNLAEMKLENAGLLRIYAWRLQEAGKLDRSIELLEKVLGMRPEEPQSLRDLALALILRYEQAGDLADAERAAELLYDVIGGTWSRFREIELLACVELNRLVASVPAKQREPFDYIDKRLRKNLDVDLRIVLSWDADNTDIDLHVVEPSGETAFYSHNRTLIGGHVSRDFTQGYGPEDYFIRKAMPGSYEIKCKYYGSSQQTLIGPATVTATIFTNYGRKNEQRQVITLRLDKPDQMIRIGTAEIGSKPASVTRIQKKDLRKLSKGDSPKEVTRKLGDPSRRITAGVEVYEYSLADGGRARIAFGPDLLWIKLRVDGAELDFL